MIYLDCAATSLQKPQSVYHAVQRAMQTMTSPGRGGHRAAMLAADTVFSCREAVADLFHVPSPEQVVFTFNATHALNLAIYGLVHAGDKVVVSGYEHNSVMRPLKLLGADVTVVSTPLFDREAMLNGFAECLPGAKVCVCTAMSNVFGFMPPIEEISKLCRKFGTKFIVDASQLAGCGSLDFTRLGADFVAMPGHKGLLGPQGTGILLCGADLPPLLAGGTGSSSKSLDMPEFLPDRLEAGTHNVPGIAGLLAGVQYVQQVGVERIAAHEREMARQFATALSGTKDLELFLPSDGHMEAGVVSLRHKTIDCEMLAMALGKSGVAVRAGLHCAPCAHESAGTLDTGTVRFSFSPFIRPQQARYAAEITKQCVNNLKT